MTKEYSDYLAHYGVKGQKWGIRRYQNEDGSLIHPKGRKKTGKKVPESDTWRKDEAKNLSDDELNRRNNRMQREFQYQQNIDNRHPARKKIAQIAEKVFNATAIAAVGGLMAAKYRGAVARGEKFIAQKRASGALRRHVNQIVGSGSGGAVRYAGDRIHNARQFRMMPVLARKVSKK